jgi:transcriptional regulator NrdR family protein
VTRPLPHERPTAQQLASGGGHQWSCRRCGCQRTRVSKTWTIDNGAVRRKRVCDNCGQDFTHTTEVPCPTGFRVVVEDEEAERAVA